MIAANSIGLIGKESGRTFAIKIEGIKAMGIKAEKDSG